MRTPEQSDIAVPLRRIGPVQIGRLICGGNLIIGSVHDCDLIYIASLMRHYFTDRKIAETWQLCGQWGIDTMIGPVNSPHALGKDPTVHVPALPPGVGRPHPVDRPGLS